ncbi:hypothetical protein PMPD1_3319 [Paramixta manurensis]|uniref:Uncharacterized protein n=1 Tax=Paramixta manurensis TaxID=2740817 RepID=A0A6M8UMU6_9GAMM|nr:hypothetical protein PMPD1_3319 [Erwiniaceae bacterium PD-1]
MRIPPSGALAFHQAVAQSDTETIQQLRQQGYRPVALDAQGDSPLDALEKRHDIDAATRVKLHQSLLASLNTTAPPGYTKPEAFHGSPWGFEILRSGILKGGVNDRKGGSQSLEGQVFFSDRTKQSPNDTETRPNLRSKPRVYAKGMGAKITTVETRSQIYQLAKAINRTSLSSDAAALMVKTGDDLPEAVYQSLMLRLSANNLSLTKETLESVAAQLIPTDIKVIDNSLTLSTPQSTELIRTALQRIEQEMVNGKMPYLNLLNNGATVPLVFGFSKINNLKTHQISPLTKHINRFSYQSEDHPLTGSANGGKLKEIEVRSLADLATLTLACQAQGITLPTDALIRINPTPREKKEHGSKAHYLDASAIERFRHALRDPEREDITSLSIDELQALNQRWREKVESGSLPIA